MQVVSETEGVRLLAGLGEGGALLAGPGGAIELRVDVRSDAAVPGADLLICHPHPLHGGTLDNKVVHTLARAARDAGLRAIRFNFRGVGRSGGVHDRGRGEVDDLCALVNAIVTASPGRVLLLAGFSFGAYVAASSLERLASAGQLPRAALLVAPPVHYPGFPAMPPFPVPVTVFQGRDDEVVAADAVADWCGLRGLPLQAFATGHFFHGLLPDLKAATEAWIRDAFPEAGPAGKLPLP
ncbi:MAG: alpha/beta hydrolase [Gammaproteobacteria bacterium]